MKINKAKSAGFCVGVKRAIDTALKTAKTESKVYMLGDIVHNEEVVSSIENAGIKKINELQDGKGKTLLIRAHGTGTETIVIAENSGYKIVDATCPMVKEIHHIASRMESKGYKIIIIGDKNHEEVQGIMGQLKTKPVIISNIDDVTFIKPQNIKKAAVVVQSTQNSKRISKIVEELKSFIEELEFFDTICKPTKIKQNEAEELPLKNDVVIVIGSKNSANTKRLFEISKELNPKTYRIGKKDEINLEWFKDAESVGITAGASTPDSTINEVIKFLENI